MEEFWSPERQRLLGKLVRKRSFDFKIVSNELKKMFSKQDCAVDLAMLDPKALRNIFSDMDRRREKAPATDPRKVYEKDKTLPPLPQVHSDSLRNCSRVEDGEDIDAELVHARQELDAHLDLALNTSIAKGRRHLNGTQSAISLAHSENRLSTPQEYGTLSSLGEVSPRRPTDRTVPGFKQELTSDSDHTFQSLLAEQRCRDKSHALRREGIFNRVLTALGGDGLEGIGTEGLPSNIRQAWKARQLAMEEEEVTERERRRQERVRSWK